MLRTGQELFKSLLESVKNHLKVKGLTIRKSKQRFFLFMNDTWCKLEFQKSISSSNNDVMFTLNLGVSINTYNRFLNKDKKKKSPQNLLYILGSRIGFFLPLNNDYWWSIGSEKEFPKIESEMLEIIDNVILPFFKKYSRIDEVVSLCELQNNYLLTMWCKNQILIIIKKEKGQDFQNIQATLKELALKEDILEMYDDFIKELSAFHMCET